MRRVLPLFVVLLAACGPEREQPGVSRAALTGTWQGIGAGVTMVDTGNPLGGSAFIAYAGFNIDLGQAQSWASALYDERLRALGVRYVYAVQGPADPGYNALELGNSRIAATLATQLGPNLGFILIAGHSSGSFVADELLQQLDTGADPFNALGSRTVFFNLDGDQKYVGPNGINRLRNAYYVSGFNPATGTTSWNHGAMTSLGSAFAGKGGWLEYDAASSGCNAGGCVHISLVNTVPHDPNGGSGVDYADFGGRPVNAWWLDAKREEAGLGQCATPFLTEGLIQDRYAAMGGCDSALGSPTTNMLATASGAGRYNRFQWGAIYWSFFTGAHDLRGAIYDAFTQANFENGPLGYPTSDELITADTLGRYNRFEHGAVYWSYGTGAHPVVEPVYGAWAAANFENGALGYPISGTHPVPGGVANEFQHGTLTVLADGTSRLVLAGVDAGTEVPVDAGSPPIDGGAASAEVAVDAGTTSTPTPPDPQASLSMVTEPEAVTGGCSATKGNGAAFLGVLVLAMRRRR